MLAPYSGLYLSRTHKAEDTSFRCWLTTVSVNCSDGGLRGINRIYLSFLNLIPNLPLPPLTLTKKT
jgi:hypothetical protein